MRIVDTIGRYLVNGGATALSVSGNRDMRIQLFGQSFWGDARFLAGLVGAGAEALGGNDVVSRGLATVGEGAGQSMLATEIVRSRAMAGATAAAPGAPVRPTMAAPVAARGDFGADPYGYAPAYGALPAPPPWGADPYGAAAPAMAAPPWGGGIS